MRLFRFMNVHPIRRGADVERFLALCAVPGTPAMRAAQTPSPISRRAGLLRMSASDLDPDPASNEALTPMATGAIAFQGVFCRYAP
jgi:hypothetical protein